MEFVKFDYLYSQGEIALVTSDVVVVNFIHASGEGEKVTTPRTIDIEDIVTEMTISGLCRSFPVEPGRTVFWRRVEIEVDDEELTTENHLFTTPLKK